MTELKKCPFCGGEAKPNLYLGNYCITCTRCMGGVFPARCQTLELAAKNWNRRVRMNDREIDKEEL